MGMHVVESRRDDHVISALMDVWYCQEETHISSCARCGFDSACRQSETVKTHSSLLRRFGMVTLQAQYIPGK